MKQFYAEAKLLVHVAAHVVVVVFCLFVTYRIVIEAPVQGSVEEMARLGLQVFGGIVLLLWALKLAEFITSKRES